MFNSCVPLVASGKAERMAIHVKKRFFPTIPVLQKSPISSHFSAFHAKWTKWTSEMDKPFLARLSPFA